MKTIWTMRNDSTYLYRWAAPDFMREYVRNIPKEITRGYYFGSDGWVWGRDFISKDIEGERPLEIQKHWFQWLLWGRLAYDPTIDNERFAGIVGARFPRVDASTLMAAWQAASMIYPTTTGFHWGALDYQWYPEGCQSDPRPARTKTGFHDVNRFITLKPHPGTGYVGIPDYVRTVLTGKPFDGVGPMEISKRLQALSSQALNQIKTIDAANDVELSETLADIKTMAFLGRYYAYKIKGATHLRLYRESGDEAWREKAVDDLTRAAKVWRHYTSNAMARYTNPMWLNRVGVIDFAQTTKWVDQDVEIAKESSAGTDD